MDEKGRINIFGWWINIIDFLVIVVFLIIVVPGFYIAIKLHMERRLINSGSLPPITIPIAEHEVIVKRYEEKIEDYEEKTRSYESLIKALNLEENKRRRRELIKRGWKE